MTKKKECKRTRTLPKEHKIKVTYKTMESHPLWKGIPSDILQVILKYDGRIAKRNGIYMNRIPLEDERYVTLKDIPKRLYYNIQPERHESVVYLRKSPFFVLWLKHMNYNMLNHTNYNISIFA